MSRFKDIVIPENGSPDQRYLPVFKRTSKFIHLTSTHGKDIDGVKKLRSTIITKHYNEGRSRQYHYLNRRAEAFGVCKETDTNERVLEWTQQIEDNTFNHEDPNWEIFTDTEEAPPPRSKTKSTVKSTGKAVKYKEEKGDYDEVRRSKREKKADIIQYNEGDDEEEDRRV